MIWRAIAALFLCSGCAQEPPVSPVIPAGPPSLQLVPASFYRVTKPTRFLPRPSPVREAGPPPRDEPAPPDNPLSVLESRADELASQFKEMRRQLDAVGPR